MTTTTSQVGNLSHHHRGNSKPEMSNQNTTEKSTSKIEIDQKLSQLYEESCSSSDDFCDSKDVVIQSCRLESENWRRRDVTAVRTVENYV